MPTALPPLALEEITLAGEDPFAALNAMLNKHNSEQVGAAGHVPLWVFARDGSGKVQGGVRGQTYWSWCTIDVLAVAQPYRRQSIGSRLLARAEEIARSRGCVGIRLDTTSFQAPDFYRRHGYIEFDSVEILNRSRPGNGKQIMNPNEMFVLSMAAWLKDRANYARRSNCTAKLFRPMQIILTPGAFWRTVQSKAECRRRKHTFDGQLRFCPRIQSAPNCLGIALAQNRQAGREKSGRGP